MSADKTAPPTVRLLLGLIVAAYVLLALGYALATPRWNNPDEPAHYNYVRELAEAGQLPVLRPGDWDADLLEREKAARFPDDAAIEPIRYEGHQPPLYYLLAAPIYGLFAGVDLQSRVLALRGLSILLGTVVVLAAFAAGRSVAPSRPAVALLAAATAAFVPMHTAISAAINNDALANALSTLTVVALLAGVRRGFDDRAALLLGLLLGALLLTKLTTYVYVPLGLAVMLWSERRRADGAAGGWLASLRRPLLAAAVAAAVAGWWFVRNGLVYGWTDPLAGTRHDAVVVGQPRWAQLDLAAGDYVARVLFRSFWGQFGWMGIVLEDRLYLLYLGLTLLALVGLALVVRDGWRERRWQAADGETPHSRWAVGRQVFAIGLLVCAVGLVLAEVLVYNLRFIQAQGRYLFPALVPIAVLLSLGWHRLATGGAVALASRNGPAIGRAGLLALGVGLGLLDLLCLVRFVGPAFR